jgi:hypothetical protein
MHERLLLGATQQADVNELCKTMRLIFTLVAIAFATNLLKEANRQINEFEDKMLQERKSQCMAAVANEAFCERLRQKLPWPLPEYKDMSDGELSRKLYAEHGVPIRELPNPWATLGMWAVIALGFPLVVLILGLSLVWERPLKCIVVLACARTPR